MGSKILSFVKTFFAAFTGGFVGAVFALPVIWHAILFVVMCGWWWSPITVTLMIPVVYAAFEIWRTVSHWTIALLFSILY